MLHHSDSLFIGYLFLMARVFFTPFRPRVPNDLIIDRVVGGGGRLIGMHRMARMCFMSHVNIDGDRNDGLTGVLFFCLVSHIGGTGDNDHFGSRTSFIIMDTFL